MKAAYFDCQFGSAGDMLLGSLIHAGLNPHEWLLEVKKIALPEDSFKIAISKVQRRTLAAMKVDVSVNDELIHRAEQDVPSQDAMRQMADVQKVIEDSPIAEECKDLARKIIRRLADCEGPVHGMDPDAVYFHEVGGVDTIVDIVGFAIGYHLLGVQKSYVSQVPIGRGRVLTAAGYFPLPAPAVAMMLASINAPTLDFEIDYECLTPTAVAILAEVCQEWGHLPRFKSVTNVGYGAGTIDSPNWPNVSRVMLGEI